MGRALKTWFSQGFADAGPLPDAPRFQHFFAGLLALADWVGSDRRGFSFVAEFQPDYWRMRWAGTGMIATNTKRFRHGWCSEPLRRGEEPC